ncbi:hypothetical protein [Nonomuraea sp. NPDC052265]|uniref:hypothetical protein n=1 Tax=Nonomuraea sp. NPDC052265 TaxID=3364374 RepID=UPI0037C58C6E
MRDLVAHIERLAALYTDQSQLAARLPAIRASIAPGAHVVTVYGVRIIVANAAPVMVARREAASALGEPHVPIFLTRDDLPIAAWPMPVDVMADQVFVIGVAARAIPGQIKQMALRPGPGLPAGWLGEDEGVWQTPPPYPNMLVISRLKEGFKGGFPKVEELTAKADAELGHARPTGRIEVNGQGGIAEVWEVTL